MKTNTEEKNVYVQPDCEVYQVKLLQMIAASDFIEVLDVEDEYNM